MTTGTSSHCATTPGTPDLKEELKAYAKKIGLDLIGFTTPEPFDRLISELELREPYYRERYASRIPGWKEFAQPKLKLPGARSVVVIGFYFLTPEAYDDDGKMKFGRILTYGHLGILRRVKLMDAFIRGKGYKTVVGCHRKEAAIRAGLGMVGKHNLVMNREYGSWVAYQTIITDAPLAADEPFTDDLCGDCEDCLKACPTTALYEARRLDPRRCVTSMLTSENIPEEHWEKMPNYIMGCDICQESCPINKELRPKAFVEPLLPDSMGINPPLTRLFDIDEREFQDRIMPAIQEKILGKSFLNLLMRTRVMRYLFENLVKKFLKGRELVPETFIHASGKLSAYKRNAIITAGNYGRPSLKPVVSQYLSDPYYGKYAEWALKRIDERHGESKNNK